MNTYVRALKQLVRESRYRVDERLLADAILQRASNHLATRRAQAGRLRPAGPIAWPGAGGRAAPD